MTDTVNEKFLEFQLISRAGKKKEFNFIFFFFEKIFLIKGKLLKDTSVQLSSVGLCLRNVFSD